MISKKSNIEDIGHSLLEHVRDAASTRPGIVHENFGPIVQASKKISARAIARFLEEQHGVKVSYVTIGRALRDPKKNWNLFFDPVEAASWIVAEAHGKTLKHFMSEPEKYQEMLEAKPVFEGRNAEEALKSKMEYEKAVTVLDKKWFCLDEDTLEDARRYLLSRFCEKPAPEHDESKDDQV